VGGDTTHVVLDTASSLYHEGMTLMVHDPNVTDPNNPGEPFIQNHVVLAVSGTKVTLHTPLRARPSKDAKFATQARPTPMEPGNWEVYDCITLIESLYAEMTNEEAKACQLPWQLAVMSVPGIELTPEFTLQDLSAAWTEFRRWLETLKSVSTQLGVVGTQTDASVKHAWHLRYVIRTLCKVYEALHATKVLMLASVSGDDFPDDPMVNPWWYSCEGDPTADGRGGEPSDMVLLTNFLLQCARRHNVRRRGATIYEQVQSRVRVCLPPECLPVCDLCEAPEGVFVDRADLPTGDVCDLDLANRRGVQLLCFACAQNAERGHHAPAFANVLYTVQGDLRPQFSREVSVGTKAWVPRMCPDTNRPKTIGSWIHEVIDRTVHNDMWNRFLRNYGANLSNLEKYLERCYDVDFPRVVPDWRFYSFQNGVYDITKNVFYPFGGLGVGGDAAGGGAPPPPDKVCSANFVDRVFNPGWVSCDPRDIPVTGYDEIIACQRYSPDMRDWTDAFFGRLFFPNGECDKWEKLMVIKGWAATGKSTIAKAIAQLIGEVNVGYLQCNVEEQWPLANVYDKFIWMCLELKTGFKLPPGVMQSMITGERVVVNVKRQTAFDVAWRLQGLLVGNELPLSWTQDSQNALARRVLPFPFDIAPPTQDAGISKRLLNDLGALLVRLVRMYLHKANEVGERKVDDLLPEELKASKAEFEMRSAPLRRFLLNNEDIEVADPTTRKLILYELLKNQHLSHAHLGISAQDQKVIEDEFKEVKENHPLMCTDIALRKLVTLWHVSMADVQNRFRDWAAVNNVGKVSIANSETYRPTARAESLAVARDVLGEAGMKFSKETWFGIRLRGSPYGDGD
jgi:hypothetical protein